MKAGRPKLTDTKRTVYTIGMSGKTQEMFDRVQMHIEAKAGVVVSRVSIIDMLLSKYMKEEGVK